MKAYHKKKGQGLSINTIIIAALGLAILVVLFAVFTGQIGRVNNGIKNADTCQQKCATIPGSSVQSYSDASDCSAAGHTYFSGGYGDVREGNVCCCG